MTDVSQRQRYKAKKIVENHRKMTKIRRFRKIYLLPLLFLLVTIKCLITLTLDNIHDPTAEIYQLAVNFSEFSKFPKLQTISNMSAQNTEANANAMNVEVGNIIPPSEQGSTSSTIFDNDDHPMQENISPVSEFSEIQINDQPKINQVTQYNLSPPTDSGMESDKTYAPPDNQPSEYKYNSENNPNLNPQSPVFTKIASSNLSKQPPFAKSQRDTQSHLNRQQTSPYGNSSKPSGANQSIINSATADSYTINLVFVHDHVSSIPGSDSPITSYLTCYLRSYLRNSQIVIFPPFSQRKRRSRLSLYHPPIAIRITFTSMLTCLKDQHILFSPFLQRKRRSRPSENTLPFSSISTIAVIPICIAKESVEVLTSQHCLFSWYPRVQGCSPCQFINYATRLSTYFEISLRVYIIYYIKKYISTNIAISSSSSSSLFHQVGALTFYPPNLSARISNHHSNYPARGACN